MTKQKALAKARELSRAQIRRFYVIEHDHEEGRSYSVATENYIGTPEFDAFDSVVIATAYAGRLDSE